MFTFHLRLLLSQMRSSQTLEIQDRLSRVEVLLKVDGIFPSSRQIVLGLLEGIGKSEIFHTKDIGASFKTCCFS